MAMKTGGWALVLLLFGPAVALCGQNSPLQWPPPAPGRPQKLTLPRILVRTADLHRMQAMGAVPLDARDPASFERGHLPGAVSAWRPAEEEPWGIERLRSLLGERGITGERPVVIYGDPDPAAVAGLFWRLRWAGCSEVRILDGGLAAWLAAGYRLETGISQRAPAELRPSPRALVVDADGVGSALGMPGFELLDVRDARGWDHWQTPPVFGAGHIPYSLPFDPDRLLSAGGRWPDPGELRRRLSAIGPRRSDPVRLDSTFIVYGEGARDPRLGLAYLLLTLAGLDARVFPGGWQEWTAGGMRPMVRVISAGDLAALLKREDPGLRQDHPQRGMIVFDLREPRDFAIGHLPGSLALPFRGLAGALEQRIAEGWPGADRATIPLVFYCYGIDCVRSRKAGAYAARLGFHQVLWFRGGIPEWRDAGLPLLESAATEAPRERASTGAAAARP